ncbi:MAG: metallophosphoesterase [Bacteroidales bacterium]
MVKLVSKNIFSFIFVHCNTSSFRRNLRRGILITLLFSACSDVVEYSPFDTLVSAHNLNQKNISKIDTSCVDTLTFAFISDSHIFYDQLRDAINNVNADTTIRFVIVGGDFTSLGLMQEYEWFYSMMKKLSVPYVVAIGNHDYLSNGRRLYGKMFGESNFCFYVGHYRWVVFDDIVWENDNRAPNFIWLREQLLDSCHFTLLVAHIPPWSDQLDHTFQPDFQKILSNNPPMFALFGHTHVYEVGNYVGVPYAIAGTIEDRTYLKISLIGKKAIIKKIDY